MSNSPRPVRVIPDFWDALDRELPAGRRPTWHDVANVDLPAIIEQFASTWDGLPEPIEGRPEYREVIVYGRLGIYTVTGQYAPDGAIELVGIEVDLEGLPDPGY